MTARPLRLAVLISGRGSNLKAILDAIAAGRLAAQVVLVLSNRPGASRLDVAAAAAVPTAVIDHRQYPDRPAFEQALLTALDAAQAELLVLAGFMRVLTADFVHHYRGRLINIHPRCCPPLRVWTRTRGRWRRAPPSTARACTSSPQPWTAGR